ncbi:MAG TPA: oxidoreductase, partial [Sphingobium sp.]
DLPHIAAGLSRRVLDGALLDAAMAAGAMVARGRAVRTVDPLARSVQIDNGEAIAAESLFLATGKHELRGLHRQFGKSSVGLRALLPPSPARLDALAGVVEPHLFDQGYAGLLVQEDGSANLCLSVTRSRMNRAGNVAALLEQLLIEAPLLADRLHGDLPARFDAVAGVPYGWRARSGQDGIFRIGDQGAVIASLAGDGIAIALTSGASAAEAMLEGGPAAAFDWQRRLRRRCAKPLGIAEALRHGAAVPATRGALMGLLRLMPRLGTGAAALTRISL